MTRHVARSAVGFVAAAVALALTSCAAPARSSSNATAANGGPAVKYTSRPLPPVLTSPFDKVMVVAEENEAEGSVIGSPDAPYLNKLATTYGQATNMQAGYPVACPSLAAYLIMTSGARNGVCDDLGPDVHPQSGDNVFQQVASAGLQWRQYAESMTTNCQSTDSADKVYLVRHAPPPYYTSEASRCPSWDVPMGTTTAGALHNDLLAGLPAYSFVTANTCNEMHGAPSCRTGLVKRGDAWLARWIPQIIASPDFQQARLAVIVTWDEGSATSNHIPTLVLTRTTLHLTSGAAYTHCSTLRTTEEVLGLPLLGCAAAAISLRPAFKF